MSSSRDHKKPQKKRAEDPTYKPSQSKQSRRRRSKSVASGGALFMRAENKSEFVTESGEKIPLKTAVIIEYDTLPSSPTTKEKIKEQLSPALKKIPSHRPIAEVITRSPSGKATEVATPGRTILKRATTCDPILFFSNMPAIKQDKLKVEGIKKTFMQSSQYKAIRKVMKKIKVQEETITAEKLEETQKEIAKQHGKRLTSQNKAMVKKGISEKHGSATSYVDSAVDFINVSEEIKRIPCEWGHMLLYAFFGEDSQTSENLLAITKHANTDMMLVESQLKSLAEKYPDGFTLHVEAKLYPRTHIASVISYRITTPDFSFKFEFDPHSQNKPHVIYADYIKELLKAVTDSAKSKPETGYKK